ncbi:phosphoribosylglycinamide formyltransferase [Pelagibius sp.]|uniref:phosphoribosylglycinamide formyltransferase n=1 Tax=Pelagibius sp. TaxID=1931238 RepID=UPI002626CECC|nr:phosphoribosylglycinamide formyltransferase [Pelagibius sp.]
MRVAVLISGRGSNLRSLLEAAAEPAFPAEIVTVIANRPGAGGLDHAATFSVPHQTIDHKAYADRAAFEAALTAALEAAAVELICLAGFMRVLSAGFVRRWQGRIVNIHPSLLPLFPGLDTHARALAAGVKLHGCSVHFVSEGVDEGAIIGQAAVPVFADDDPDRLAARVLQAEHRLYPHCLRLLAESRVRLAGGRAVVEAGGADGPALFNPDPGA